MANKRCAARAATRASTDAYHTDNCSVITFTGPCRKRVRRRRHTSQWCSLAARAPCAFYTRARSEASVRQQRRRKALARALNLTVRQPPAPSRSVRTVCRVWTRALSHQSKKEKKRTHTSELSHEPPPRARASRLYFRRENDAAHHLPFSGARALAQ